MTELNPPDITPPADADPHMARIAAVIRRVNDDLRVRLACPVNDSTKETTMSGEMIDSTSDQEKEQMRAVKDAGLQFHELLTSLGDSRELQLARVKVEEAVMWATKHITY